MHLYSGAGGQIIWDPVDQIFCLVLLLSFYTKGCTGEKQVGCVALEQ